MTAPFFAPFGTLKDHWWKASGVGKRVGNAAWGHGYHKGFSDGAVRGGIVVGAVLVVVDATIRVAPWAYRKLKARAASKYEETMPAEVGSSAVSAGSGADEPTDTR